MTVSPVFAEIDEAAKWVEVYFRAEPVYVEAMKSCSAIFVPKDRAPEGIAFWRIPLDYATIKRVVRTVGRENIAIGDALLEYGKREKARLSHVSALADAKDGELRRLPEVAPRLFKTLRPYQRADIRFMTDTLNALNANQPGLGKTLEAIGTVFENGSDEGPTLVVAPLTSLDIVWCDELAKWQDYPAILAAGSGWSKIRRECALEEAKTAIDAGWPSWVLVNPAMVRFTRFDNPETGEKEIGPSAYPWLHEVEWANVIIDECHKNALRDPTSITAKGIKALKIRDGGKRIPLSGTPMGGKEDNLFGILQFLHPKVFTSRWRWRFQWLEVTPNGYGYEIGGVRPDLEEAFWEHLKPYIIRHTKEEVLPELPPKQFEELWVDMTPRQEKQYREFASAAQIKIGEGELSATSILAEYVRLKQFSGAEQLIRDDGSLQSLPESGKLNALMEKLEELGILDGDGTEQAVVFSQFEEMVDMICAYLASKEIPYAKITGSVTDSTKAKKRTSAMREFQGGAGPRVMVMTTGAGGMSVTLDRASNVFILDETWNPDDQEQAADRCHRASRIHQVTIWHLRSRKSIDEYIKGVTDEKGRVNRNVLDGRRMLRLV